jgi:hypothetical protein
MSLRRFRANAERSARTLYSTAPRGPLLIPLAMGRTACRRTATATATVPAHLRAHGSRNGSDEGVAACRCPVQSKGSKHRSAPAEEPPGHIHPGTSPAAADPEL